jgi:hypothetical protein
VLQNVVLRGAQLTRRLNEMARDHRLAKGTSGGILEVFLSSIPSYRMMT